MRRRSPAFTTSRSTSSSLSVPVAIGGARHASQERRHLATGTALGKTLQILPTRIHETHDDGRELLPEHKGPGHREGGNDIQAHIAAPQACYDLDEQCAQDRHGRSGPDHAGPLPISDNTRPKA